VSTVVCVRLTKEQADWIESFGPRNRSEVMRIALEMLKSLTDGFGDHPAGRIRTAVRQSAIRTANARLAAKPADSRTERGAS